MSISLTKCTIKVTPQEKSDSYLIERIGYGVLAISTKEAIALALRLIVLEEEKREREREHE